MPKKAIQQQSATTWRRKNDAGFQVYKAAAQSPYAMQLNRRLHTPTEMCSVQVASPGACPSWMWTGNEEPNTLVGWTIYWQSLRSGGMNQSFLLYCDRDDECIVLLCVTFSQFQLNWPILIAALWKVLGGESIRWDWRSCPPKDERTPEINIHFIITVCDAMRRLSLLLLARPARRGRSAPARQLSESRTVCDEMRRLSPLRSASSAAWRLALHASGEGKDKTNFVNVVDHFSFHSMFICIGFLFFVSNFQFSFFIIERDLFKDLWRFILFKIWMFKKELALIMKF